MSDHVASAVDVSTAFDLGPVDQIGFAVADLDASLPVYAAVFGPFTRRASTFSPDRVQHHGQPSSATLELAFARSGDVEIELVQVTDGDAPAAEHVRAHGEGLHHVRFTVDDVDAKRALMEAAGFTTVLAGTSPRGSRFVYLERPDQLGHTQIELLQEPPHDLPHHPPAHDSQGE